MARIPGIGSQCVNTTSPGISDLTSGDVFKLYLCCNNEKVQQKPSLADCCSVCDLLTPEGCSKARPAMH